MYRLPTKENLVLYVRITFAELKRLIYYGVINNFVALSKTVEVGCPRHPGATLLAASSKMETALMAGKT